MKLPSLKPLFLAFALALSGCGLDAAPLPEWAEAGEVTAHARLAPQRGVLAVDPWTRADIDHVRVALYRGADAAPSHTQIVPQSGLGGIVRFANLRRHTSYKVVLTAWSDADETSRIDNFEAAPASCTVTFSTTSAPMVDVGWLKLTLRDKIILP